MNFKRPRHREDILFVIALVIPAVLSAARYFETEQRKTQIARAQSASAQVALHAPPATLANLAGSITPPEATGSL
jgi:hypothetical protein